MLSVFDYKKIRKEVNDMLTQEDRKSKTLIKAEDLFVSKGMCVDFAIHDSENNNHERN